LSAVLDQIRSSKTYERLARHEIVRQFVKYALVGALNVAIVLVIFNVLHSVLDVPILAANAIAFVIASVNSFFLNKRWAFRDASRDAVVRQYIRFVFFTLIGLGLQTGAFSLLLIPLRSKGTIGKNVALLSTLPVSVIWNFTCYRLWTFSATGRDPSPGSAAA
jgi:putative flippase GtrA